MNRDIISVAVLSATLTACGSGSSVEVNDPPTLASSHIQLDRGQSISHNLQLADKNGDSVTARIVQTTRNGDVSVDNNGIVQYTPNDGFYGNDTFTVEVSDGTDTVTYTVTIDVNLVNTAPTLSSGVISLDEDQSITYPLNIVDADDDVVAVYATRSPNNGSVTIASDNKSLQYTPTPDFFGSDSIELELDDGIEQVSVTFDVFVEAVNDKPVINTLSYMLDPGSTNIEAKIDATDVDGDALTYSVAGISVTDIDFELNPDSGEFIFQDDYIEQRKVTVVVNVSDGNENVAGNLVFRTSYDELYAQQWHLKNTAQDAFSNTVGTLGHDINAEPVHKQGILGAGVNIAIVDSGLEIAHPDLVDNVLPGRSYDYLSNDNDPSPIDSEGDHGTSVAGLSAAVGYNGIGGRGVAPDANLLGFNWLKTQGLDEWVRNHGGDQTDDVLVINESYGLTIFGPESFDAFGNDLAEEHLKEVTKNNNQGRGVLLVKSAGNSFVDQRNFDLTIQGKTPDLILSPYYQDDKDESLSANIAGTEPDASSIYHTIVSALNANAQSPLSSYSTVGASVWVSAPGGEYGQDAPAMITTDVAGCDKGYAQDGEAGFNGDITLNENCNYVSTFNGTSSAAPVVSGVAALLFSANDKLTWRDVRHIMASTAKKIHQDFVPISVENTAGDEYVAEPGWFTNDAGYNFHNWYGFGLVDAEKAIEMALDDSYSLLPELKETAFIQPSNTTSAQIPESMTGAMRLVNVSEELTVEAVQVKLSVSHGRDSDLAVELVSPSGTKSVVLQPRSLLIADQADGMEDTDFNNTVLLSNAFYGEPSEGTWLVKVIDTNDGNFEVGTYSIGDEKAESLTMANNAELGILTDVSIRIYGHEK
ncbi:S8 family serine peptidase [Bermanella sp. R86510]|uniref:S8 family serine peptidase n=1 Tax=unclassified Bermanella TaxID=2627862 RepID=UPI0037C5F834